MHAFPISIPPLFFPAATKQPYLLHPNSSFKTSSQSLTASHPKPLLPEFRFRLRSRSSPYSSSSNIDSTFFDAGDEGIQIEIEKLGKNSRKIRSRIPIEATLQTVWNVLTDYERLSDFIPGLALCQLIEKRPNFVRLFQIGQQNLAFGLKFNAKGLLDCYEKDLESLPSGQRRDIEFKMIEGDFRIFEGRWSIEQCNIGSCEHSDSLLGQEFHTTLSYVVDVEPKLWLPVGLVEGRLCREIKVNLSCIREEAQKVIHNTLPAN